jgi:hypothetical protein
MKRKKIKKDQGIGVVLLFCSFTSACILGYWIMSKEFLTFVLAFPEDVQEAIIKGLSIVGVALAVGIVHGIYLLSNKETDNDKT